MRNALFLFALWSFFALSGCGSPSSGELKGTPAKPTSGLMDTNQRPEEEVPTLPSEPTATGPTAKKLEAIGLVDVRSVDPTLAVHLVYATPDNFVGEVMYDDLREAYLLPEAAEKLAAAHRSLKMLRPDYRLIVYDAARPMSVQKKMWEIASRNGKQYYVANPAKGGGLHNFGAAVDLSILDESGRPLPMGTEYDHLGYEANTDREEELVRSGAITRGELDNRLLLRRVMTEAGFRTVRSEWWHFNHCSREQAQKNYPLIDF